jgi:hypothetical protein
MDVARDGADIGAIGMSADQWPVSERILDLVDVANPRGNRSDLSWGEMQDRLAFELA